MIEFNGYKQTLQEKKLWLFIFPFIINFLILGLGDYWGFREGKEWIFAINLIAVFWLILGAFFRISPNSQNQSSTSVEIFALKISTEAVRNLLSYFVPVLFGLQFLLFIVFPIRNMNYGDGILLLENVFLEGKLFGFQLTLDEFWEAFLHSYFFNLFHLEDPRTIYRIFSSFAGFLYLGWVIRFFFPSGRNVDPLRTMIFLSPGGLLLFYGYAENYTLVSLILFLTLILGRKWIQDRRWKQGKENILLLAILAALGASFHLVFGYMIFALAFFSYTQSKKDSFVKNSLIAGIVALGYIGFLFGYFLFWSDPTTSPSQTHVLKPPIYPWKRWISIGHFKEILGVTWFSSFFPFLVIVFSRILNPQKFKEILSQDENKFLVFSVMGFYIHAFFHNPSLGFPADWDLFSFYFLPLLLLGYYLLPCLEDYKKFLYPIVVYSIAFQITVAINLNKNPEEKEEEYRNSLIIARSYLTGAEKRMESMDPSRKKLFLTLDYFLYKADTNLKHIQKEELKPLASTMQKEAIEYKKSLYKNSFSRNGSYPKIWIKQYLMDLTDFHHRLIKIRREDKKYHLGKEKSP